MASTYLADAPFCRAGKPSAFRRVRTLSCGNRDNRLLCVGLHRPGTLKRFTPVVPLFILNPARFCPCIGSSFSTLLAGSNSRSSGNADLILCLVSLSVEQFLGYPVTICHRVQHSRLAAINRRPCRMRRPCAGLRISFLAVLAPRSGGFQPEAE